MKITYTLNMMTFKFMI